MNAYELADEIENFYKHHNQPYLLTQLQSMLRQQANRIAELEDKLSFYELKDLDKAPQTKPLSDEEINTIWHSDEFWEEWTDGSISAIHYNKFARAIEERHGIK